MDTIITTGTQANKPVFVRVSLILTGVVIAILCAYIAFKNIQSTDDALVQERATPITQNTFVKAVNFAQHSAAVLAPHINSVFNSEN